MGVLFKNVARAEAVALEDVLIGFKEFPGKSEDAHLKKVGGKIKYAYHLIPVLKTNTPMQPVRQSACLRPKNPDGKGTYTIYSFAAMLGYMTGEAYKDIVFQ